MKFIAIAALAVSAAAIRVNIGNQQVEEATSVENQMYTAGYLEGLKDALKGVVNETLHHI